MTATEYPISKTIAEIEDALTNKRDPNNHAASHKTTGEDFIRIDELAAATDNTKLNASTTKHGLCQKGDGDATHSLLGDMSWGHASVNGGTPAERESEIYFRCGTSADLANRNPIPGRGEGIFEYDTFVFKIGNGVLHYNSLPPLNFTSGTPTTGSGYRKSISISHDYVTCDLENFPVFVPIVNDSNIGAHARADGYDIRFVLNDNTELDYERVYFNISGGVCNAIFWVRVPDVTSESDTGFFIKYGVEESDGANPEGVWDSNFKRVYHLEETGTASAADYKDSTDNDGDSVGTTNQPTRATGIVGYGQDFDGTNDQILFETTPALEVTGDFTFSWTSKGVGQGIAGGYGASKIVMSDTFFGIYGVYDTNAHQYTFEPESFAPSADFHRYSLVKSSTTLFAYMDGEIVGFQGVVAGTSVSFSLIGSNQYWEEYFDGIIDEFFISDTSRSAEWLYAEAVNINSPTSFLSFGSETTY